MTPKQWLRLEVSFETASWTSDTVYALTECLVGLGSNGVEEADNRCITYFAAPEDPVAFRQQVERAVSACVDAPVFVWSVQPHEEWAEVWRQGFRTHPIGERLSVGPPWIDDDPGAGRTLVVIDPGLAFGTAEHGSTRSCLTLIESKIRGGETVLDVGAGSGVLSIAALRLGASHAECVELDAMACEALRENAEHNGVTERTHVICAPFGPTVGSALFEVVVCNMVRGRLLPILPELAGRVNRGGLLVLGGIQAEEREEMLGELAALGPTWGEVAVCEDEGWLAFRLARTG